MAQWLGNINAALTGTGGLIIGFVLIGLVFVFAFLPLVFWLWRRDQGRPPRRRSGLERFSVSLETPDEGFGDRIPESTPPVGRPLDSSRETGALTKSE